MVQPRLKRQDKTIIEGEGHIFSLKQVVNLPLSRKVSSIIVDHYSNSFIHSFDCIDCIDRKTQNTKALLFDLFAHYTVSLTKQPSPPPQDDDSTRSHA